MPGSALSTPIVSKGYPRAALAGNPSDGYFGKTIAFTFSNFEAEVVLASQSEQAVFSDGHEVCRFDSLIDFHRRQPEIGYTDKHRLVEASVKCFIDYCLVHNAPLPQGAFAIGYRSNIPFSVGLAGSSAIVVACYRVLMAYCDHEIAQPLLVNEVYRTEFEELGIGGGLQDRVAQVYQGLVYMDFDQGLMESRGFGRYHSLDAGDLPFPFVAFRDHLAEHSGILHSDLRQRWNSGDVAFIEAMGACADAASQVRNAVLENDWRALWHWIDTGFDRRISAVQSTPGNLEMIGIARALGACANQAGSGGSVVGFCHDEAMRKALGEAYRERGIQMIHPVIAPATADCHVSA